MRLLRWESQAILSADVAELMWGQQPLKAHSFVLCDGVIPSEAAFQAERGISRGEYR
jgi:hypothetical protein